MGQLMQMLCWLFEGIPVSIWDKALQFTGFFGSNRTGAN